MATRYLTLDFTISIYHDYFINYISPILHYFDNYTIIYSNFIVTRTVHVAASEYTVYYD
jgi:hypothetical protein